MKQQARVTAVPTYVGFVLLAVLVLAGTAGAATSDAPLAPVQLETIWARPAIKNGNSAIYFNITNTGTDNVVLVGATSDVAAFVEVHETIHDTDHETHGHVMHMEEVPEILIAPGTTVSFTPGGKHVMLIQLQDGLKIGDHVVFTLYFQDHAPLTARATVMIALD